MKLSDGTLTGTFYLKNHFTGYSWWSTNVKTATAYFVQTKNPYVETRFNMVNHKIINLGDPTDGKDAVNKHF